MQAVGPPTIGEISGLKPAYFSIYLHIKQKTPENRAYFISIIKIKITMAQVTAPEVEQPENKTVDLIPEERLKEILNILLPYGYSYHNGRYTGVSPYIGDRTNIITIVANDPAWGSMPLSIIMEAFDEESNEDDSLGFYKGIMKLIAPELHSEDEKFKGNFNVLDFSWAPDMVQDNRFPAKVEYCPETMK